MSEETKPVDKREKHAKFNTSHNGQEEYRTFKLVSVNDHPITKDFNARNTRPVRTNHSIGATRAAGKIFTSYCTHFGVEENTELSFKIIETTKGPHGKIYDFIAKRQKLNEPYYLEKIDGKLHKILQIDEATNQKNVITYQYKNIISSSKK